MSPAAPGSAGPTGSRGASLVMGLMSGTSHDGIDAALVGFKTRGRPALIHHSYTPFGAALRRRIAAAPRSGVRELALLHYSLGEEFARAAIRCMKEAGVGARDVAAIASHGQTVCHVPRAATFQAGAPAVIAARTGVPVVSDFRAADIAAGGEGAPLVPYADYVLFHGRKTRMIQNVGGIANLTAVTPRLDDVRAFDTGPGNCLMDEAARTLAGRPFDREGRLAARGAPDMRLLGRLMAHPFLKRKPPKSTHTDVFSLSALGVDAARYAAPDLLATLALYTARSIAEACRRFLPRERTDAAGMIVSGGGLRNRFLMKLLAEALSPLPVQGIEEAADIPTGAKEAMSFAILARATLRGRPSNVPGATGAAYPALLGSITPAPRP